MPLQIRPQSGGLSQVAYAPARDIAHLYPNVIQHAENFLYEKRTPALHEWIEREGVTEDELAETVRTFCVALNMAHQNPEDQWHDVLKKSGFEDQPEPAKIGFCYYIGTLMTTTFFMGLRDIVMLGDDTTPEIQRLGEAAEDMARYMNLGPLGRKWYRFKRWLRPPKRVYTLGGKHGV